MKVGCCIAFISRVRHLDAVLVDIICSFSTAKPSHRRRYVVNEFRKTVSIVLDVIKRDKDANLQWIVRVTGSEVSAAEFPMNCFKKTDEELPRKYQQ